ncbi:DNA-binding PucR family transcriptional regulator [Crossiella equi]|uniref:DNA-binding PucR family transcriptional regulator n=1 Tax=Crossiella equi TaxID=130796 RepID=A0ABS5AQG7_9PSEU|nr:helix-turn-helix domain-containing protein [Crossiella equi]MBP2478803.1 DNA-binding PucR family transcriptional regulator [Crossiella equi]
MSGARNRLDRVLADLGTTVLAEVLPGRPDAEVSEVVVHDPAEPVDLRPGGLLLGVGLRERTAIASLLSTLGGLGATALLVKAPVPVDEAVRAAAVAGGVALLEVSAAASWAHVLALLQSRVSRDETSAPGAGLDGGDLFALANAVAALLDAPVTIEDRSSRVLAFSAGQDSTDASRVATVLGRQVPRVWQDRLTERGVFRELYRSTEPIFVDLGDIEDSIPRAAVAVRAGEEILGSMWAAVRAPLTPERGTAFRDAAQVVALHLMRQRAGADVQRRLRADLLATVLEGGPGAADAASRLGLAGERLCVLAAAGPAEADPAAREAAAHRLCDALSLHLRTTVSRPTAAAPLGEVVYGLLPVTEDTAAARIAEDFRTRTGTAVRIGVGRVVPGWPDVARSRADADAVLRALGPAAGVARLADVHLELLLTHLADLVAGEHLPVPRPVLVLREHDREHGTEFVATLLAYLDAFGDVGQAARSLHVHPNTFRYRLRRLTEISGLDLADARARLSAHLHLLLP